MGKGKEPLAKNQKIFQFRFNVELREIDSIAIFELFCGEGLCSRLFDFSKPTRVRENKQFVGIHRC